MKPLAHRRAGTAGKPPVLLIHGFGGRMETWLNMEVALERDAALLLVDLPGHGRSRDSHEPVGAGQAAKAVAATLDHLGGEPVFVVGHSMGGAVGAVLAMTRPDLVRGALLLAPGGMGPEVDAAALRQYAREYDLDELARVLRRFYAPGTRIPRGLVEELAREREDPATRRAHGEILLSILKGDNQHTLSMQRLGEATPPIHVMWGDADEIIPSAQLANLPENVTRELLPGIGHMVHLEATQAVARKLRTLIAEAV
ncbi:MAG: alpha/beta fold hydrolase [Hyphomicrobiaceae bacterium]|nr:alpha/beta fold hydrolase [Hyphomicrobiaceae bacterium]